MMLNVEKALKQPGENLEFDLRVPAPVEEFQADQIGFSGDVALHGYMTGIGDSVALHGELTAALVSPCARCLEEARFDMKVPFDEIFVRQPDPDHPDAYLFEGSEVDLTDLTVANIAINLPLQFLCREDCKGLCPLCGQNLNLGSCGCDPALERSAFSALKALLDDKDDKEV